MNTYKSLSRMKVIVIAFFSLLLISFAFTWAKNLKENQLQVYASIHDSFNHANNLQADRNREITNRIQKYLRESGQANEKVLNNISTISKSTKSAISNIERVVHLLNSQPGREANRLFQLNSSINDYYEKIVEVIPEAKWFLESQVAINEIIYSINDQTKGNNNPYLESLRISLESHILKIEYKSLLYIGKNSEQKLKCYVY